MLPVIVISPVRNESWILPLFLNATLKFADHVIVADQASIDDSAEIVKRFERTTLVINTDSSYNEESRQQLLINTARRMFPGPKVIFALDADEIISGNSLQSLDWKIIRSSTPNTIFYFEKPELYRKPENTIRYRHNLYPLAFVDDGTVVHVAKKIHSIRIPSNQTSKRVNIHGITFLHASYLRPTVQRAKYRFYAVKENDLGSSPWYRRRRRYRNPNHMLFWEPVERSPEEWFKYPPAMKVDFTALSDTTHSWYDKEVLNSLVNKGGFRYWLDDIWDINWNNLLENTGRKRIWHQPNYIGWLLKKVDAFL